MPRTVGFDLDMTLVDTGPGIHDALTALAAETGRPIDADDVVAHLGPPVAEAISKLTALAVETLRHAGIRADLVIGEVWAADKAGPLREHAAVAYVGDHPGDMVAAVAARIPGVGVTSGAASAEALTHAGATVVLDSLQAFLDWLQQASAG